MNIVFGDRKQFSPNINAQYITEPCGSRSFVGNQPLPCEKTDNVTDQFIENVRCGAFALDIKKCAKPDFFQCQIGESSKKESPVVSVTWLNEPPNIRCFFDQTKIDTINQLNNFKTLFGDTEQFRLLASRFCSLNTSSKCLKTGKCSRLKSIDDEGNFCRSFFNNQTPDAQESIAQNICFSNPDLAECSCFTRSSDTNYKRLAISAPFKDSCWYVPCRDSFNNFIPQDLKNPTCPANVCQFIIDAANNNNVNISEIQSSIACQTQPNPTQTSTSPVIPIAIVSIAGLFGIFLTRKR
jgi:hypothetical protein